MLVGSREVVSLLACELRPILPILSIAPLETITSLVLTLRATVEVKRKVRAAYATVRTSPVRRPRRKPYVSLLRQPCPAYLIQIA